MEITFEGGFAWVFDNDEAIVSLVHLPESKFNHSMVLEVATPNVQTTAQPISTQNGKSTFELTGDVTLLLDGQATPGGGIKKKNWHRAYGIARIISNAGPVLPADWRGRTSVRLRLSAATLEVQGHNRQACTFVDGNAKTYSAVTLLATGVKYQPTAKPKQSVEFRWANHSLKIVPIGGKWPSIGIQAECACGSVSPKIGDPLPGFDDVFYLYRVGGTGAVSPHFLVSPRVTTLLTSAVSGASPLSHTLSPEGVASGLGPGPVTPGPDCPFTEHFA